MFENSDVEKVYKLMWPFCGKKLEEFQAKYKDVDPKIVGETVLQPIIDTVEPPQDDLLLDACTCLSQNNIDGALMLLDGLQHSCIKQLEHDALVAVLCAEMDSAEDQCVRFMVLAFALQTSCTMLPGIIKAIRNKQWKTWEELKEHWMLLWLLTKKSLLMASQSKVTLKTFLDSFETAKEIPIKV